MTEPCYICKDDPKFRPFCSRCGGTGQHSPTPPSSQLNVIPGATTAFGHQASESSDSRPSELLISKTVNQRLIEALNLALKHVRCDSDCGSSYYRDGIRSCACGKAQDSRQLFALFTDEEWKAIRAGNSPVETTCEHGTPLSKLCDSCRTYLQSAEGRAELLAFAARRPFLQCKFCKRTTMREDRGDAYGSYCGVKLADGKPCPGVMALYPADGSALKAAETTAERRLLQKWIGGHAPMEETMALLQPAEKAAETPDIHDIPWTLPCEEWPDIAAAIHVLYDTPREGHKGCAAVALAAAREIERMRGAEKAEASPAELVGALQDKVHTDGPGRAAFAIKAEATPSCPLIDRHEELKQGGYLTCYECDQPLVAVKTGGDV